MYTITEVSIVYGLFMYQICHNKIVRCYTIIHDIAVCNKTKRDGQTDGAGGGGGGGGFNISRPGPSAWGDFFAVP